VACVREQAENRRMYLRKLVFGDPAEPYRRAGLVLAARLEDGITGLVARDEYIRAADAETLARVQTDLLGWSLAASWPSAWPCDAPNWCASSSWRAAARPAGRPTRRP
jgi:hypothetical protein